MKSPQNYSSAVIVSMAVNTACTLLLIFICSCKGCDFSSLNADEQKKYQKMYERPELFFCTDAGLAVAVVDDKESKRHR